MALKLGPERFYSYIRAFGFGSRSGIQLPSETRGLLRPPKRWGATSIGSLAIGQEVGVTPMQLVSMVSTIGNGGVYLPPSIVLEQTSDQLQAGESLKPLPFHPGAGAAAAAARGCAPRDLATDLGQDAQDDGRRRAEGHRPECRAEWLLRRAARRARRRRSTS